MQDEDLNELAMILRRDGDQLLDATSKLSLSASLLSKINQSFSNIITTDILNTPFHVFSNHDSLNFLYDFMQKTLALKLFPDYNLFNDNFLDLRLFHNLKLLEVHRLSLNLVKGLKSLRSQLEYVTCMRSVQSLKDILENCGADKTQGYVWCELKEAVFSHNNLVALDGSLEFTPSLQSLDLSFNCIKNFESLNCLSNLKYLNLGNNKITTIPPFTTQLSSHLQVLILRNNFIEDIKEIEHLTNIKELDLTTNCLFDFNSLLPLSNLQQLQTLYLQNNPLSYHKKYRTETCQYLHSALSGRNFLLDGEALSKRELRVLGSVQPMKRSESFNSTTTANTVIQMEQKNVNQTSDMEISTGSVEVVQINYLPTLLEQGMHDSGFVSGPRPISPSDSIGSATSLNECKAAIHYSESDIEVLSNPSQSSIEVLIPRPVPW